MEKYTIIENDIIECINSGKLKNGEKIPSESELCEKYKVSRTTVRKALANLSTNGKIIRKIGDGSYVNDQVFVNNTGRALSFTEDMEKNGKVPGSQVLNFKVSTGASNPEIAQNLKLKKNESFSLHSCQNALPEMLFRILKTSQPLPQEHLTYKELQGREQPFPMLPNQNHHVSKGI